jgi:hypothetical protein
VPKNVIAGHILQPYSRMIPIIVKLVADGALRLMRGVCSRELSVVPYHRSSWRHTVVVCASLLLSYVCKMRKHFVNLTLSSDTTRSGWKSLLLTNHRLVLSMLHLSSIRLGLGLRPRPRWWICV